jgi:hypothetical protein
VLAEQAVAQLLQLLVLVLVLGLQGKRVLHNKPSSSRMLPLRSCCLHQQAFHHLVTLSSC